MEKHPLVIIMIKSDRVYTLYKLKFEGIRDPNYSIDIKDSAFEITHRERTLEDLCCYLFSDDKLRLNLSDAITTLPAPIVVIRNSYIYLPVSLDVIKEFIDIYSRVSENTFVRKKDKLVPSIVSS